jgi:L-arabinokinase
MHIAYYITGHGYGHALRSATIAQQFSASTRLTFVSNVPERFFKEEIKRPFFYRNAFFDCGCVQADSVTVDVDATLATYRSIAEKNRGRLQDEVAWCAEQGITGIVGDVPPFAFSVARHAGLPSIAVTNFSWYDIYREYISESSNFSGLLQEMHEQYTLADQLFALSPALPMAHFSRQQSIPPVARIGMRRDRELRDRFGVNPENRLALIYFGDFGMNRADWGRLADFYDWDFFGLQEIPGASKNYHRIVKSDMWYPDMIASADCVIGKLGYGLVSECMANGTPIIYLPRPHFAEYPELERVVSGWGGGVELTSDSFFRLDWEAGLDTACRMRPPPIKSDGAAIGARAIEAFFRNISC